MIALTATWRRMFWPQAGGGVPVGVFVTLLAMMVVVAILAPLIAPYDPNTQNLLGRLKPPGTEARGTYYLLGSDELGRDLLSRMMAGARSLIAMAVAGAALGIALGTMMGMSSG
ncbi:MAG: hypothetical protein QF786_14520, partial [Vicinamibacterales bacterium]|nr:hypothetical protein [Vicinamibacterales bacterium]